MVTQASLLSRLSSLSTLQFRIQFTDIFSVRSMRNDVVSEVNKGASKCQVLSVFQAPRLYPALNIVTVEHPRPWQIFHTTQIDPYLHQ
jgi:hypothetical protein